MTSSPFFKADKPPAVWFHCNECDNDWPGSRTAIDEDDVQCPECGGYDVELD